MPFFSKNSSIFKMQYLRFSFPARLRTVHMLVAIKIEEIPSFTLIVSAHHEAGHYAGKTGRQL